MKYLIAGLGNIGAEYKNTRHNIGFTILDSFIADREASFLPARYGDMATVRYKGRQLFLLKPSTYMNLSGRAVNYWLGKENISAENLLVLLDDLALPFGKIRLRPNGSDGGHNGLTSIIQVLGHQSFARLRFGIGNGFQQGAQVNYVLGEWTSEEKAALPPRLSLCYDIILSFSTQGVANTMNLYNNK